VRHLFCQSNRNAAIWLRFERVGSGGNGAFILPFEIYTHTVQFRPFFNRNRFCNDFLAPFGGGGNPSLFHAPPLRSPRPRP
jgi:hypothetical protein